METTKSEGKPRHVVYPPVSGSNAFKKETAFFATMTDEDFEEHEIFFTDLQTCIKWCQTNDGWSWREVSHYYR